jgi:AraC family transcriptional regulator
MSDIEAHRLLATATVTVRDMRCAGTCRRSTSDEHAPATHIVFPYRGIFVRRLGRDEAVAEANQVLFFNRGEGYRVSHPLAGGDDSLDLIVSEPLLAELAPRALLHDRRAVVFQRQRLRIDPGTQALAATLRHRLRHDPGATLEGETRALTLVRRALGPRTTHAPGATPGVRRLVDRAKIALAADLTRRWTLAELGAELGHSPVYLTQIFQQVEGVPLYRYHLRLRLARALDLLPRYDDLTALGLDLGFSSHSHFTTAFRHLYGQSPSTFRSSATGARGRGDVLDHVAGSPGNNPSACPKP